MAELRISIERVAFYVSSTKSDHLDLRGTVEEHIELGIRAFEVGRLRGRKFMCLISEEEVSKSQDARNRADESIIDYVAYNLADPNDLMDVVIRMSSLKFAEISNMCSEAIRHPAFCLKFWLRSSASFSGETSENQRVQIDSWVCGLIQEGK